MADKNQIEIIKRYGLIGYPLGHSWSGQYFDELFKREGLSDCRYDLFPIADIRELPNLLNSYPDLKGLNVTIPHKESVMAFLHAIDPMAAEIGAVNTIKIDRRKGNPFLTGYNTDAWGFGQSLQMHGIGNGDPEAGSRAGTAIILGSGGAAKAVYHALRQLGWQICVVARDSSKADWATEARVLSYAGITSMELSLWQLIINTTPLGMHPNTGSLPDIPYASLSKDHILYDLVYNPSITGFLKNGMDRGCRTIGGIDMLTLQAGKAWEIWNS